MGQAGRQADRLGARQAAVGGVGSGSLALSQDFISGRPGDNRGTSRRRSIGGRAAPGPGQAAVGTGGIVSLSLSLSLSLTLSLSLSLS